MPSGQGKRSEIGRFIRSHLIDTGPIRQSSPFRRLITSEILCSIPEEIAYVAVPFQAYRLTHSSLVVGEIALFALIPMILSALAGGMLADVVDKKHVIMVARVVSAISLALLLENNLHSKAGLALLFIGAMLRYLAIFLRSPSVESMIPNYVAPSQLAAAAATFSSFENLLQLIAVPIAGVMIAALGLRFSYTIAVAISVVSIAYTFWLSPSPPHVKSSERTISLKSMGGGFRYALTRKDLLGTYLIDFLAMLFGVPNSLFPQIAASSGGAGFLGLMYAAPSFGSFLIALGSGWTANISRYGKAITIAATIWGLAIIPIGFTSSPVLILIALTIAGGADMVSGIFRRAFWNLTIPRDIRGRMAGLEMISYTSGPAIGGFESGLVERLGGLDISIASGGILCVASVALAAALLPRMWKFKASDFRQHGSSETVAAEEPPPNEPSSGV